MQKNKAQKSGGLQPPADRKKYERHAQKTLRINLSISGELLDMVDKAAKQDYTTRSDMIRMAILWYLRPQGRELDQTDPEAIFKTLQHRRSRAKLKKVLKGVRIFDD